MRRVLPSAAVPPTGWVWVAVPGVQPAWVERGFAEQLDALIRTGRVLEAKTLMLWFGGIEDSP